MNAKKKIRNDLRECYCYLVNFPPLYHLPRQRCSLVRLLCFFLLLFLYMLFSLKSRLKKVETPNSYSRQWPEHISPECRWIIIPVFFFPPRLEFFQRKKKSIHQKQIRCTVISSLTSVRVWDCMQREMCSINARHMAENAYTHTLTYIRILHTTKWKSTAKKE